MSATSQILTQRPDGALQRGDRGDAYIWRTIAKALSRQR